MMTACTNNMPGGADASIVPPSAILDTWTWQYLTHQVPVDDLAAYERQMAALGRDGWELVSATPLAIGKRFLHQAGDTNALLWVYKRRLTPAEGR